MKTLRLLIIPFVLWAVLFSVPRQALADEYDDSQSHPLRILAYLVHPVGVLAEWVVFRPFHAVVSGTEELEYVFGHNPHPPLFAEPAPAYDYGVPKRVPLEPTKTSPKAVSQEPTSEKVIIKEIPVEKIVTKEVPVEKIVEVEKVVLPDVAFEFDSAKLTDLGKGEVYLVAERLKEQSDLVVVIAGHADYIGTEEYNQKLGLRRAETVIQELTALGVAPERMSTASFGETQPKVGQETDWARAVNRRVELRITAR
jgi:outer membrane protein OmpA-like peptidoglycan-associated protein